VEFEWDPNKAANNFSKHGVRFAEAVTVFEDDAMLTMPDDDPEEECFVAIGMGSFRPARPRAESCRSTREGEDEKTIRF
jgi:uncharacterized DUF497 family protein